MAELTKEQVQTIRAELLDCATHERDKELLHALCDLAIRALEQTNAAGHEARDRQSRTLEAQGVSAPGSPAPAAPHSEPQAIRSTTTSPGSDSPTPARSEPAGWICTHKNGTVHHYSTRDGWSFEIVMTAKKENKCQSLK